MAFMESPLYTINMGPSSQHRRQACLNCKARKTKCSKALPSCGSCIGKGLDCQYASHPPAVPPAIPPPAVPPPDHTTASPAEDAELEYAHPMTRSLFLLMDTLSDGDPLPSQTVSLSLMEPTRIDMAIYRQARRIIEMTGQVFDGFTALFFEGLHNHLPIIDQKNFNEQQIAIGPFPAPGFSILLLSICLLTYYPDLVPELPHPIGRQTLYLAVKSLFAQVQGFISPSVNLIQAGILLALYEYSNGRPDDAFISITSCARIGYAAFLHCKQSTVLPEFEEDEAANTWWGIIICERFIFCEISAKNQPLTTSIPIHDQLPTIPETYRRYYEIPPFPTDATIGIIGLQHSAYSAWLLDQVLGAINCPYMNTQYFIELNDLDSALQSFLVVVMQRCGCVWGVFCVAIATSVRALFMLHWHILDQLSKFTIPLGEWRKKSDDTLDAVTKLVVDMADAYKELAPILIASKPAACVYIIEAALKHINDRADFVNNQELQDIDRRLQLTLSGFKSRWEG